MRTITTTTGAAITLDDLLRMRSGLRFAEEIGPAGLALVAPPEAPPIVFQLESLDLDLLLDQLFDVADQAGVAGRHQRDRQTGSAGTATFVSSAP